MQIYDIFLMDYTIWERISPEIPQTLYGKLKSRQIENLPQRFLVKIALQACIIKFILQGMEANIC